MQLFLNIFFIWEKYPSVSFADISPRGTPVLGRKTPLPLRGISPGGEKILIYLVELHLFAEIFPPYICAIWQYID